MLTIWRCVSPSISDHIYRYGPIWTATLATWHCGLKDANHACLGRICDLTDGKHACLKDANHACLVRISDLLDENHACFAAS